MSKYYVNKFLFTVDRTPNCCAATRKSRAPSWPPGNSRSAPGSTTPERSTVHSLTDEEREALPHQSKRLRQLFETGRPTFLPVD